MPSQWLRKLLRLVEDSELDQEESHSRRWAQQHREGPQHTQSWDSWNTWGSWDSWSGGRAGDDSWSGGCAGVDSWSGQRAGNTGWSGRHAGDDSSGWHAGDDSSWHKRDNSWANWGNWWGGSHDGSSRSSSSGSSSWLEEDYNSSEHRSWQKHDDESNASWAWDSEGGSQSWHDNSHGWRREECSPDAADATPPWRRAGLQQEQRAGGKGQRPLRGGAARKKQWRLRQQLQRLQKKQQPRQQQTVGSHKRKRSVDHNSSSASSWQKAPWGQNRGAGVLEHLPPRARRKAKRAGGSEHLPSLERRDASLARHAGVQADPGLTVWAAATPRGSVAKQLEASGWRRLPDEVILCSFGFKTCGLAGVQAACDYCLADAAMDVRCLHDPARAPGFHNMSCSFSRPVGMSRLNNPHPPCSLHVA